MSKSYSAALDTAWGFPSQVNMLFVMTQSEVIRLSTRFNGKIQVYILQWISEFWVYTVAGRECLKASYTIWHLKMTLRYTPACSKLIGKLNFWWKINISVLNVTRDIRSPVSFSLTKYGKDLHIATPEKKNTLNRERKCSAISTSFLKTPMLRCKVIAVDFLELKYLVSNFLTFIRSRWRDLHLTFFVKKKLAGQIL